MIKVAKLSKSYGPLNALDSLSFNIKKGEIYGFLGPNGAGKTTAMRVLSGYMPPTSGSVTIANLDIQKDSMELRHRIGYMPETVPLYDDMRVAEYLHYRSQLKGVRGRQKWDRVGEVINLCGLTGQERRIIGQLSKGNRQKVGLADSLLNKPDVLILDEPTIGMDPNQIRQVRDLLRSLTPKQTILFSSHILTEVEAICDRVLIINNGQLVVEDTPAAIIDRLSGNCTYIAELNGPRHDVVQHFNTNPHIMKVKAGDNNDGWTRYELLCDRKHDLRTEVFDLALKQDWKLRELTSIPHNLEEAFTQLTNGEISI